VTLCAGVTCDTAGETGDTLCGGVTVDTVCAGVTGDTVCVQV